MTGSLASVSWATLTSGLVQECPLLGHGRQSDEHFLNRRIFLFDLVTPMRASTRVNHLRYAQSILQSYDGHRERQQTDFGISSILRHGVG
jgi:hypothetical protein